MTEVRYKSLSSDSEYILTFRETVTRDEKGKRKRSTDWWGKCTKSSVRNPPFEEFKTTISYWDNLVKIGLVEKIN